MNGELACAEPAHCHRHRHDAERLTRPCPWEDVRALAARGLLGAEDVERRVRQRHGVWLLHLHARRRDAPDRVGEIDLVPIEEMHTTQEGQEEEGGE